MPGLATAAHGSASSPRCAAAAARTAGAAFFFFTPERYDGDLVVLPQLAADRRPRWAPKPLLQLPKVSYPSYC